MVASAQADLGNRSTVAVSIATPMFSCVSKDKINKRNV